MSLTIESPIIIESPKDLMDPAKFVGLMREGRVPSVVPLNTEESVVGVPHPGVRVIKEGGRLKIETTRRDEEGRLRVLIDPFTVPFSHGRAILFFKKVLLDRWGISNADFTDTPPSYTPAVNTADTADQIPMELPLVALPVA